MLSAAEMTTTHPGSEINAIHNIQTNPGLCKPAGHQLKKAITAEPAEGGQQGMAGHPPATAHG